MDSELNGAKNRKVGRPQVHPGMAKTVRFTVALSPWEAALFVQARRCDRQLPDDLGTAARLLMLEHIEDLKEKFATVYEVFERCGGGVGPNGPDLEAFSRLMEQEADVEELTFDPEFADGLEALDRALKFVAEYRAKP